VRWISGIATGACDREYQRCLQDRVHATLSGYWNTPHFAVNAAFTTAMGTQLLRVMTAWVAPAFTVTVWVVALKLPPVTLTTLDDANTGSWTNTGPPGSVPVRLTVMTRPAAGLV